MIDAGVHVSPSYVAGEQACIVGKVMTRAGNLYESVNKGMAGLSFGR